MASDFRHEVEMCQVRAYALKNMKCNPNLWYNRRNSREIPAYLSLYEREHVALLFAVISQCDMNTKTASIMDSAMGQVPRYTELYRDCNPGTIFQSGIWGMRNPNPHSRVSGIDVGIGN